MLNLVNVGHKSLGDYGTIASRGLMAQIQRLAEPLAGKRVLHLSATSVSPNAQAEGLNGGADGYLVQPLAPEVLVATVRSLLRLHRAEEALRRSERDLSDFFDNASIGLHWVGPDGIIMKVNQTER